MICNIIQRNTPLVLLLIFNIIPYYFDLVKTSAVQTFVKLFVKNIKKYKISEKEFLL